MSKMRACVCGVLLVTSVSAGSAQDVVSNEDGEVLELAQTIVASVAKGDASVIDGVLDWDAIGEAVTKGIDAGAGFKAGFLKGVRGGSTSLGAQICKSTKDDGSYTFLRKRQQSGRTTLLFRMLSGSGAMNYHEFQVARDGSGRLRFPDVYIYLSGEMLTETLRNSYLLAAAESKQGLLDKLLGKERDLLEHAPTLTAMAHASSAGNFVEVVRLFGTLPASLRRSKMCLIMKLQAEMNTDEKGYAATIEEMERLFSDDPALDLISIDGLYMKKKYHELDAVVDRLDRRLGGDAYLDCLRGAFHFEQEKFDIAKKHYRRAIEREPALANAWWSLVTISLREKDWKETAGLLTRIEENLELELADLEEVPEYAGFVQSEEYAKWKRARARK